MQILDPIGHPATPCGEDAACDRTQQLATHIGGFTADRPEAFWLWHPIPNDPFLALARRHRPALLTPAPMTPPDDEATALAVETLAVDGVTLTDALAVTGAVARLSDLAVAGRAVQGAPRPSAP